MRTLSSSLEELRKTDIPSYYYSVGYAEEAICIERENEEWIVYNAERGSRFCIKHFASESEACDYFVERVKKQAR